MNQIKNFTVIFILGILISSCAKQHNLTVDLEGLNNDTILVEYAPVSEFMDIGEPFVDTIIATNGKFTYDLSVQEPVMAYIYPKAGELKLMNGATFHPLQKYMVLLIRPDDQIEAKGQLHDYCLEFTATGSDFNQAHGQVRNQYIEDASQLVEIELEIDSLRFTNGDNQQINKLIEEGNQIRNEAYATELEYIKNNLDKDLSAFYLSRQEPNTFTKYYEILDEKVKNGIFKNMLGSLQARQK